MVFGGRCQWVLDAARQAVEWLSQPLGFESLALRGHSTSILLLDTGGTTLIIKSGGRRSVPILRKAPDDYRGFRASAIMGRVHCKMPLPPAKEKPVED